MMQKFQRLGSAMFVPVLFFAFSGTIIGLATLFTDPLIVGGLATEGTVWMNMWYILDQGAWTIFNQMPLLFAMGIPVTLANKARGRAVMETIVIFLTYNYFINAMLTVAPNFFGVDITQDVGGTSGLAFVSGIKTLDMNILGAIIVSAIAVWLHNRYFDTELPEFLGIFQGSAFIVILGFVVMLPTAFLTTWIWPVIQELFSSLQTFMGTSGKVGVWLYIFLEKILLPTGLHHFIYGPFQYGDAVISGGTYASWLEGIQAFSQSTEPLIELFPEGGFAMQGNSNIFGLPAAALAMYVTAKKENKRQVAGLLIPATLTAIIAGITEPLEFTYIFVSPFLFAVKAFIDATMATTMYAFGVTGAFGGGLLEFLSLNWIPLFNTHGGIYIRQIIIGIVFFFIYFIVFKFLIQKFDIKTPGRGEQELRLFMKEDVKEKRKIKNGIPSSEETATNNKEALAKQYLEFLGGEDNIDNLTNCATRLRVNVKDPDIVASDAEFRQLGATGVVRNNNALQVIVGTSVQNLRENIDEVLS
ncbi:MAG TPA: alpha-glucoside-specific PTS transporter subunit IIBC [Candidatus Atopostipes pullistercoris]|uniref:Alpha-glucoside-specific PTS transporter subunit IIBC n=1 Tax=Candidatus Atopostipes pullistercoris TaxID=2838467 RepID=A0A9D2G3V9_9LACT|nr:alpha-glucoside-specific PTS transporter subunit IIBC [Candidatus Atopostipes pullistercoris]